MKMRTRLLNYPVASMLLLAASVALAQEKAEQVSPDRTRTNFGRPVVLTADDVRAFPDAPAGFNKPPATGMGGRTEVFEYNSTVTGTRRKAVVYLPPHCTSDRKYPVLYLQNVPHLWNVHDHGHDSETRANNLYNFAPLLFR
jgi:enterochelin esterase-like enzyme